MKRIYGQDVLDGEATFVIGEIVVSLLRLESRLTTKPVLV